MMSSVRLIDQPLRDGYGQHGVFTYSLRYEFAARHTPSLFRQPHPNPHTPITGQRMEGIRKYRFFKSKLTMGIERRSWACWAGLPATGLSTPSYYWHLGWVRVSTF